MDETTPLEFHLSQNYPNPFKEKTKIKYCVAYKTRVQITVSDHNGNVIEELVDDEKAPGTYEVVFKSSSNQIGSIRQLKQGYYSYRMYAGDFVSEIKWFCINKLSGSINMKSLLHSFFFWFTAVNIISEQCF
jgi:hypothetical protein